MSSCRTTRSSYWPSVPPGQHEDLFSLICCIEKKYHQKPAWESYEDEFKEILVWWSSVHNMRPVYKSTISYVFNYLEKEIPR